MEIIKPGIKTTEFFITLIGILGSTAAALAEVVDPKLAMILSTIATVFYTISRGWVKR